MATQHATLAVAHAFVIALLVSGCSGPSVPGGDELALAQTKSPAQLLRNQAGERLLPDTIEGISEVQDFSEACKDPSEDPDGLWRAWHSTVLVAIQPERADQVQTIAEDLALSFDDEGWDIWPGTGTIDDYSIVLIKAESTAQLHISTSNSTVLGGEERATIEFAALGPCVLTDGPGSAELDQLE